MNKDFTIKNIKPNHNIVITSPKGKSLTLDFNSNKLIIYGDLEYDNGAKIFFEYLNTFFQEAIQDEVNKRK